MLRSPGPSLDLRAALSTEIAAAQELLSGPLTAQAIHAGRLQLKRARALARIGREGAPGLAKVFDETARAAAHLLAPARELSALSDIAAKTARKAGKKAAAALREASTRLESTRDIIAPVDRAALAAALKDLHALAQVWPDASPRQTARGAKAIIARARRARAKALATKDLLARHAWRRREKQRLYAAEAVGAHWPKPRKRRLTAKLCQALGDERDMRILLARLTSHPALANDEPAPKTAIKALRRRAKKIAKRADALGRKLRAAGA